MTKAKFENLLIATGNEGKLREFQELFKSLPVNITSLKSFPNVREVPETGLTFDENAALKAAGYALQTGLMAIADDSGLEVSALNGEPGIFSARYAGIAATNEERIEKLLKELEKTKDFERKARFVCVIALSDAKGNVFHRETGICNGMITDKPRGDNGFGYDPIFIPDGFDKTFAELNNDIKQQISHRGLAAREILRFLRDFLQISLDRADITE